MLNIHIPRVALKKVVGLRRGCAGWVQRDVWKGETAYEKTDFA